MPRVTRKFTMDTSGIYSINDGVISKVNVLSLLESEDEAWNVISKSGDNVGWCTAGKCLMFTEDNRVVRVDTSNVINLMMDEMTLTLNSPNKDITILQYDSGMTSDESLVVDDDYKHHKIADGRKIRIGMLPVYGLNVGVVSCAIMNNPVYVYTLDGAFIYKEHILDYIICHGESWFYDLRNSDKTVGFILNNEDVLLRATSGKIERLLVSRTKELLNYRTTTVEVEGGPTNELIIASYDGLKFPDSRLLAYNT